MNSLRAGLGLALLRCCAVRYTNTAGWVNSHSQQSPGLFLGKGLLVFTIKSLVKNRSLAASKQ